MERNQWYAKLSFSQNEALFTNLDNPMCFVHIIWSCTENIITYANKIDSRDVILSKVCMGMHG